MRKIQISILLLTIFLLSSVSFAQIQNDIKIQSSSIVSSVPKLKEGNEIQQASALKNLQFLVESRKEKALQLINNNPSNCNPMCQPSNTCLPVQPKYCKNNCAVNDCQKCGCYFNFMCQPDGTCAPPKGDSCLELIPEHNDKNANDSVNVVFLAYDFPSSEEVKKTAEKLVNINGDGSYNDTGLLSHRPFRDYKNKFNIWYLEKIFEPDNNYSLHDNVWKIGGLMNNYCPDLKNKQNILLVNGQFASLAPSLGGPKGGNILLGLPLIEFSNSSNLAGFRLTLLHEFGHSFGGLADEAIIGIGSSDYVSKSQFANCDAIGNKTACPKWCNEEPLSVNELKNAVCDDVNDELSCNEKIKNNLPCQWTAFNSGFNSCLNIVDFCTSFKTKETCKCLWLDYEHPYFKSNCIPSADQIPDINIGKNCIPNTGCYMGCAYSHLLYRSTKSSLMRNDESYYGYVNEQQLVKNINLFSGNNSTNKPPQITVSGPQKAYGPQFTLTGTATDTDGTISSLNWSIADGTKGCALTEQPPAGIGTPSASRSAAITCSTSGEQRFSFKATDNTGAQASSLHAVSVSLQGLKSASYTLSLHRGWNLISSQIYDSSGPTSFINFENNCQYASPLWRYDNANNKYARTDYITLSREAFWLSVAGDCTVNVRGDASYTTGTLLNNYNLQRGWNFIGSAPQELEFSKIKGTCTFVRGPYGFNTAVNQWELAGAMQPGQGYVVNVADSCQLKLAEEGPPPFPTGLFFGKIFGF